MPSTIAFSKACSFIGPTPALSRGAHYHGGADGSSALLGRAVADHYFIAS